MPQVESVLGTSDIWLKQLDPAPEGFTSSKRAYKVPIPAPIQHAPDTNGNRAYLVTVYSFAD